MDDLHFGDERTLMAVFGDDGDMSTDSTCADLVKPMGAMVAMAEAISEATDAVAHLDWAEAVSNVVEGWNSIAKEPRIVIPRKVKFECRKVWQKRSEGQYHQRIAQSHNRLQIQARKEWRGCHC